MPCHCEASDPKGLLLFEFSNGGEDFSVESENPPICYRVGGSTLGYWHVTVSGPSSTIQYYSPGYEYENATWGNFQSYLGDFGCKNPGGLISTVTNRAINAIVCNATEQMASGIFWQENPASGHTLLTNGSPLPEVPDFITVEDSVSLLLRNKQINSRLLGVDFDCGGSCNCDCYCDLANSINALARSLRV